MDKDRTWLGTASNSGVGDVPFNEGCWMLQGSGVEGGSSCCRVRVGNAGQEAASRGEG